jgi:hypothetical protein
VCFSICYNFSIANQTGEIVKTIRFTEVRTAYAQHNPDGHWFDRDSMKFFSTKLPEVAYQTNAGTLFVTSEVNPSGVKAYSVRRYINGDIKTIGDFHSFPTAAAARAEIKRLDNLELPL